jgi:VWFA-related protein
MPLGGPMSQTNVLNNQVFDPNTAPQRNNRGIELNPPREVHTLNDAILEAAKALSKTERGRRRVIYVISDGKEYGSKAKFKEVVQYLQTHRIAVFGTLVGDSSLPVIGFLDNIHVPLTMRDNILRAYVTATGGSLEAQFRQKNIEQSFINIAKEVRTQYTVGYYSHEPMIDGKFRTIEVKVMRPDLTVLAKKGYFPSVNDARPTVAPVASH